MRDWGLKYAVCAFLILLIVPDKARALAYAILLGTLLVGALAVVWALSLALRLIGKWLL